MSELGKPLRGGSILFAATDKVEGHGRGYITSVTWSTELKTFIALGLYQGGLKHSGEHIVCAYPLKGELVKARIVAPMFIDPHGSACVFERQSILAGVLRSNGRDGVSGQRRLRVGEARGWNLVQVAAFAATVADLGRALRPLLGADLPIRR